MPPCPATDSIRYAPNCVPGDSSAMLTYTASTAGAGLIGDDDHVRRRGVLVARHVHPMPVVIALARHVVVVVRHRKDLGGGPVDLAGRRLVSVLALGCATAHQQPGDDRQ